MKVTLRITDLAESAEEVRETHISRVFLAGDRVWKVKKPVSLGFLDFSTLEGRRAACEAEVELGARLAPDVYLRVVPLEDDYAVEMRRLRDEDNAEAMLARGELGIAEVDRIAERIAAFHAHARADETTAAFGTTAAIERNVIENFAQTRGRIHELMTVEESQEIEAHQLEYLRERGGFFADRIAHGRVRDGHGDLRLEHVYFEQGSVIVIDCIEFNDRFRFADVCADVAFLAMDLAWHGRTDLAERFLATYARESCDFDLYRVVDFYEGYRAYVRAKIAAMGARDAEARRYLLLALAADRPRLTPPMLIALGGTLATGKSTIADRLGAMIGAPSINTDRVRKHLVGARPTDKLYDGSWSGAYQSSMTDRVYASIARSARAVLGSRRPVILDASFRTASSREQVSRIARGQGVPFLFVECTAPDEVCRERLRERAKRPSVSDGRLEIFDDIRRSFEPVTELSPERHLVLDTSQPFDEVLARLRERIA
jgi:aminoglycoside phosphotransferase family enzyme/predicted kinase